MQRTAENICRTKNHTLWTREQCVAFEVHPPHLFYPIATDDYKQFYFANTSDLILNKIGQTIAIHTWNGITGNLGHSINEPGSAYSMLAKRFCPKIHALVKDDWFSTF